MLIRYAPHAAPSTQLLAGRRLARFKRFANARLPVTQRRCRRFWSAVAILQSSHAARFDEYARLPLCYARRFRQ